MASWKFPATRTRLKPWIATIRARPMQPADPQVSSGLFRLFYLAPVLQTSPAVIEKISIVSMRANYSIIVVVAWWALFLCRITYYSNASWMAINGVPVTIILRIWQASASSELVFAARQAEGSCLSHLVQNTCLMHSYLPSYNMYDIVTAKGASDFRSCKWLQNNWPCSCMHKAEPGTQNLCLMQDSTASY